MIVRDPRLAEAIGALLGLWRYNAAMTQEQVAEAMGSFREVVCRLEQGRRFTPTIESLAAYARATGGDLRQVWSLVDAWYGCYSPRGDVQT